MKRTFCFDRLEKARFLFHASGQDGFSVIISHKEILFRYIEVVERMNVQNAPSAEEFWEQIECSDTWGGGKNQPFSWHTLYDGRAISITEIFRNRGKYFKERHLKKLNRD